MSDNQQILSQYHGNLWILTILLVLLITYLIYSDTMKKTNAEIISQAKQFHERLSISGELDFRNRSHVIEVNNFMVRHGETLKALSHNTKPNLYAILLGFLSCGSDYLGMKVYKDI
jgi:hypothetical protein